VFGSVVASVESGAEAVLFPLSPEPLQAAKNNAERITKEQIRIAFFMTLNFYFTLQYYFIKILFFMRLIIK
jgi:hypothetical protein